MKLATEERIYITEAERQLIAQTPPKECWICDVIINSILKDEQGNYYIPDSVLEDEGMVEHLEQIIKDKIENRRKPIKEVVKGSFKQLAEGEPSADTVYSDGDELDNWSCDTNLEGETESNAGVEHIMAYKGNYYSVITDPEGENIAKGGFTKIDKEEELKDDSDIGDLIKKYEGGKMKGSFKQLANWEQTIKIEVSANDTMHIIQGLSDAEKEIALGKSTGTDSDEFRTYTFNYVDKEETMKGSYAGLKRADEGKNQLEMGKKEEMEHEGTFNKIKKNPDMTLEEFATSIAEEHIDKVKDYYTKLKKYVEPEEAGKKPKEEKPKEKKEENPEEKPERKEKPEKKEEKPAEKPIKEEVKPPFPPLSKEKIPGPKEEEIIPDRMASEYGVSRTDEERLINHFGKEEAERMISEMGLEEAVKKLPPRGTGRATVIKIN